MSKEPTYKSQNEIDRLFKGWGKQIIKIIVTIAVVVAFFMGVYLYYELTQNI